MGVCKHDVERQGNLEAEGISFIRFTNEQVEQKLEFIIQKIEAYINNIEKPL